MTFAVSWCIFSSTSGIATPGRYAPNDWKPFKQRAIERREEPRHALHVEDVDQLVGGPRRTVRAERLVGELHQRHLVAGRVDHAIELGLLPPLGRRLQLGGPLAQEPREMHRLLHLDRMRRRRIDGKAGEQLVFHSFSWRVSAT